MKKALLLILLIQTVISNAQQGPFGYYKDALIFSQANTLYGSTARIRGIGGASVALGGDLSSISSNPAGLGFYNRSVFTVTPSLDFSTADSKFTIPDQNFSGSSEESFKNGFNFSNIGTVINFSKGDYSSDKFKGGSLGISLNRLNGFNLERNYEGINDYNSIIDTFLGNAGQSEPGDLGGYEAGAYDQYLVNPTFDADGNIDGYDSFVAGFPIQTESIKESGSHYQLNVAWGGNYDDRLYFGGGMGIQILNYRLRRNYMEDRFEPAPFLNSLSIVDDLEVRGAGIDFNFGTIVRPVEFLTLGISYTSPSFISLDEENFFDVAADWKAGTTITETDDDGNDTEVDISSIDPYRSDLFVSEYKLRTPSKVAVGTTIFVGKSGFLTGDLEFVDYSNANINSSDFPESADNNVIDNIYTSVTNIRVGGEYRIDNFRLRAGYAFLPSPYKNSDLQDRTNLTFGFGYRTSDYFLDFAVVNSETQSFYTPYDIANDQPIVATNIKNTSVSVTFGLSF
ncbi:MAG: outer membrane protein transport protein [Cyclobacteriaceae bacterium]